MKAVAVTLVLVGCFGMVFGQQQQFQQRGPELDPCETKTRTVAHESQCDAYYSCYNGHVALEYCPNGLMYQGKSTQGLFGVCDYPFNVDCTARPETNPPIATEHCEWLYGIFGHETSCTRYWTCWNGTATEQFCIGGLLYSEDTHACDWPQNVGGCQKHPLCKEDPNANVPLGKSCERYWACQGGYPRLQRCPATLVFDRLSRRCVNPPTQDCDIPSTTPRPQREQQQRQESGQQQQFQDQRSNLQRPRVQQRRPRPQPTRQEQEVLPQEQFVEPPQEQFVDEPRFQDAAPQEVLDNQPIRPQRPRLPFIPSGATPVDLSGNNNRRLPPIPGAIPINFN